MEVLTTLLAIVIVINVTYSMDTGDYFWHNEPNLTTTLTQKFTKFFYKDSNITYCVVSDESETHQNLTYFPKCCPPSMNYNSKKRACYESSKAPIYDDLDLRVNVIKSGLSDCEVVVDHLIEKYDFSSLIEINKSLNSLIFGDKEFQLGSYCLDDVDDFNRIVRVCYNRSYCDHNLGLICVQKCCGDGEVMTYQDNSSIIGCQLQQTFGFYKQQVSNSTFTTGDFAILHHAPDCTPQPAFDTIFTIDEEGLLLLNDELVFVNYFMSPKNYCIETIDDGRSGMTELYMCLDSSLTEEDSDLVDTIQQYLRIFSLLCLFMVMVNYYFVYRLKKLIHWVVFSYCVAVVFEQLLLALQLYNFIDVSSTVFFAVLSTFASCTWSNVMCYDIWHALRSVKQNIGHRKAENFRKMTYYSIYGWLLPVALALIYKYDSQHRYILKFLHLKRKQFNTIFFFLPLAIFSLIDAVCFTLTLCYIIRAKSNLNRFQNSDVALRNREVLVLYTTMTVKLFLLMGVTQLISTVHSIIHMKDFKMQYNIPIFFQMIENVEGVIVFLVLVFKWNCFKFVVKRWNIFSRSMTGTTTEVQDNNI